MQISGSFPATMREIEEIFRKNPQLKLHRFKAFRAWYRYNKEWEKKDKEFYALLVANGMTPHEEDPYFDANAPDWEQFADDIYYDDDDEERYDIDDDLYYHEDDYEHYDIDDDLYYDESLYTPEDIEDDY